MPVILDEAGSRPVLDQAGGQVLDEAASLVLPPNFYPVGITVEILINGTWTDISTYVYQRDNIVITGGNADETTKPTPAKAVLTLDNRDGRFSPAYTAGAYFPYLTRNVQLRISATATSVTGNFYSGYRFWGEVAHWPPLSDPTGTDVYVQIEANGPLRRIRAGGGKGSALTRYYSLLKGSFAPIAYWPCEEDPDTNVIGAGIDGGTSMTVTTGTPKWKAISDFNGSAPIGILNKSTWDGLTGSFGSSGDDIFDTPGTHQWTASTSTVTAKNWAAGAGGGGAELGQNGNGGGGGGGEFASATLAVTPGTTYNVIVGAGGTGGAHDHNGTDGGDSVFAGDVASVHAHGGKGGNRGFNFTSGTGGAAGTGSTATTHHDGGSGGNGSIPNLAGGSGGGSGGTAAAGNNGGNSGAATAAVTGGGPGGAGGHVVSQPSDANGNRPATGPGGGGGGGDSGDGNGHYGANGWSGQVELVYTPASQPNNNVIRWIMLVPSHGGNPGKVMLRALTGGTIAKIDVIYQAGGHIQVKGFAAGGSTLFDTGSLNWLIDGVTLMFSVELANSGANVAWKFAGIVPGSTAYTNSVSGTVTTASVGNVTEVIAGPNADITKTAIGHISVQYALVDLTLVSKALHGHTSEMGIDRFIRLANEQALANNPQFREQQDHFGFEGGVQGWTANSGAVTQSNAWSSEGNFSLLLTATGEGFPVAFSPFGTSGIPVNPGDIVSLAADVFCPVTLNQVFVGIKFFTAAGAAITEVDSADQQVAALQPVDPFTNQPYIPSLSVTATAPATAAFFNVRFGNHDAGVAAGSLLYADRVRIQPKMGAQTRKEYHEFLQDILELDSAIMGQTRDAWGFSLRTRWTLFLQAPALTLDYAQGHLSGQLAPVVDDQKTKNHITVHRHKGSKVTVTRNDGQMSVQEPPAGAGRYKKHLKVTAERDEQLVNLANLLLTLGTDLTERYPVIEVNLARSEVAGIMSAIAGVELGDFIQIINLPFWYPSPTARQLVVGYTETLNAFNWEIQWNCTPESPYELSVTSVGWW
jgi:hypothetical protein